jgi:serpin B
MHQSFRLLAVLAASASLVRCGGGDPLGPITELPRELSVAERQLIEVDNRFGLKLFREVNTQDTTDGNLFISPLSVAMALGMTYNGADGETREAMARTLELEDMTIQAVNEAYRDLIALLLDLDPRVEFGLANSIWYRNTMSFEQAFLDVNREYFDAEIAGLDFSDPSAAATINAWVNDATRGKIEEIVEDPIGAGLVMFLINAIYFKGDWAHQFDKDLTRDDDFTLLDGTVKQVETMRHRDPAAVRVSSDDLVYVIDLPYGGDAFSMTILLPRPGVAVDDVIGELDGFRWQAVVAGLEEDGRIVALPKFTFEYELLMNDVLEALGMGVAFGRGGPANFSKMRAQNDLVISEVKHKTFVDVNEEGTEAAAVTSVSMGVTGGGPSEFHVDRPFVFAIRERFSGTIIFIGKIQDPEGQS